MIQIITGSKSQMNVRLYHKSCGQLGDPVDLTPATQIKACFDNEDGTELELLLTTGAIEILGNPLLGKLRINLTAAQTAGLAVVDHETLELDLVMGLGVDPVTMRIPDAYAVEKARCST